MQVGGREGDIILIDCALLSIRLKCHRQQEREKGGARGRSRIPGQRRWLNQLSLPSGVSRNACSLSLDPSAFPLILSLCSHLSPSLFPTSLFDFLPSPSLLPSHSPSGSGEAVGHDRRSREDDPSPPT